MQQKERRKCSERKKFTLLFNAERFMIAMIVFVCGHLTKWNTWKEELGCLFEKYHCFSLPLTMQHNNKKNIPILAH